MRGSICHMTQFYVYNNKTNNNLYLSPIEEIRNMHLSHAKNNYYRASSHCGEVAERPAPVREIWGTILGSKQGVSSLYDLELARTEFHSLLATWLVV